MNKHSILKQLMEVLNSLDRSLDVLIENVRSVEAIKGSHPQPVPVPLKKGEHLSGM